MITQEIRNLKLDMRYRIIISLLIIAALLIRPTALGQTYSSLGIVISIIAFVFFVVKGGKKISFCITSKGRTLILLSFIFWLYCGIQSILLGSTMIEFALKAIVTNIIVVTIYSILLSDEIINFYFFRNIIIIFMILILSYYITAMLSMFISLDKLFVFQIPIYGYESSGKVYLPFTIAYDPILFNGKIFVRLLGIYRESGISQMFYIWSFFICENYFKAYKKVKVIMILGIVATFSTTGFITFFTIYILKSTVLSKKKKVRNLILGIVICGIFAYVMFCIPGVGIQEKFSSNSTSMTDRTYAIQYGIEMLKNNPIFGVGFYNNSNEIQNSGINFISSAYTIGMIGCILYFNIYLGVFLKSKSKSKYILCIFPLLITLLFSEPLIDSPFIYFLLLGNFDDFKICFNSDNIKIDKDT